MSAHHPALNSPTVETLVENCINSAGDWREEITRLKHDAEETLTIAERYYDAVASTFDALLCGLIGWHPDDPRLAAIQDLARTDERWLAIAGLLEWAIIDMQRRRNGAGAVKQRRGG
jgi:hypothetical protein